MTKEEIYPEVLAYFHGDVLAANMTIDKYFMKTKEGNILERTPDDIHRRMAKEFARIESTYPNPLSEEEIYQLFKDFKYVVPQGSPMVGIGNPHLFTSLSNCFVIGEHHADSYGGIMRMDEEQTQIMKRRGGVGHDLSHLRPAGAMANNSALNAMAGAVSYAQRYSNSTKEVRQGDRRGALMLSMSVLHPDVEKFIDAKMESGKITDANISVRIINKFMKAVKEDGDFIQTFPIDLNSEQFNSEFPGPIEEWPYDTLIQSLSGTSYATRTKAKKIWDKIIYNAWKFAEPGVLFWDQIIKESPADCYEDYQTISTNPSLRGDTLVNTELGFLPIKEVAENYPYVKLLNIDGQYCESYTRNTGHKQLYKITFSNNQTVFCTAEHKWPILSGINRHHVINVDGSVKKKETPKLKNGDRIYFPCLNHDIHFYNNDFTQDDGFVLGWIYGDGWETQHDGTRILGFVFGDNDIDNGISSKVLSYTNNLTQQSSQLTQGVGKSKRFNTQDKSVVAQFDKLGWNKDKSLGIPESVFRSNVDFIKGVVDGLFSSDGHVFISKKKPALNAVVFTTIHQKLASDLRRLLSLFGISSTIYDYTSHTFGKDHLAYRVHIGGSNIKQFNKIFSLSHIEKQRKLQLAIDNDLSVKNWLSVKSVEITDSYEDVYDATVNDWSHTFFTEVGLTGNCGEIPLCADDACRLLLLNLYGYVLNPFTKEAKFDINKFAKDAQKAQRLMDDIVDLEIEKIEKILAKIHSDPEPISIRSVEINLWTRILNKTKNGRRTGLGVTGEGDMLAALGLRYGTSEATAMAVKVHKTLSINSYISSIIMAEERGAFTDWNGEKEMNNPFIGRILEELRGTQYQWMYEMTGRRNISNLTISPAGSVSICTQTTSGIEPVFLIAYKRRRRTIDKSIATFIDEHGEMFEEYNVFHHKFVDWMKINKFIIDGVYTFNPNDQEQLDMVIKQSPYYKATSADVDWKAKVDMQGQIQQWIDHSISATTNVPENTSVETVADIYMTAYESGCKGMTIYREGSRSGILVSNKVEKLQYIDAVKRLKVMDCDIYHKIVLKQNWMILVGKMDDKPYEIFNLSDIPNHLFPTKIEKGTITKVKSHVFKLTGKDSDGRVYEIPNIIDLIANNDQVSTRKFSLMLRHRIDPKWIVQDICEYALITSFDKAIQRVLSNYIQPLEGLCPVCKSKVIQQSGCTQCIECGWSLCS